MFSLRHGRAERSGSSGPVVYLHIGAMKSGTTFLQTLLWANRESLAASGYLLPGDRWMDQDRAVRDILRLSRRDERLAGESAGKWQRLADQMLGHDGVASLFSMEFLSFADARQAKRVVASLEGADVHVVLTVRDAMAAIPSQWQTACRNARTVPWPTYVEGASSVIRRGVRAQGRAARMFRRTQGIPRMLDAWGSAVPADRLHVVTVPPRGSDPMLLWHRFAGLIGVDPAVCPTVPEQSNPSLGHASAELMRLVNVQVEGRLTQSDYHRTLKGPLARHILAPRAHVEQPVRLDRDNLELAAQWNQRVRRAVRKSGASYLGEEDDLPATVPDAVLAKAPAALEAPTPEQILAAAATARDGLLELTARRRGRLSEHREALTSGTAQPTTPARWTSAADPVGAAAAEVTQLVLAAVEALRDKNRR